jgi:hypothetical protein
MAQLTKGLGRKEENCLEDMNESVLWAQVMEGETRFY